MATSLTPSVPVLPVPTSASSNNDAGTSGSSGNKGFSYYLESGMYHDLELVVWGRHFSAHRIILAQSSQYFATLLRTKEKSGSSSKPTVRRTHSENAIEDPNNAKKSANEETNKTVDPASDEAVYSQPESGNLSRDLQPLGKAESSPELGLLKPSISMPQLANSPLPQNVASYAPIPMLPPGHLDHHRSHSHRHEHVREQMIVESSRSAHHSKHHHHRGQYTPSPTPCGPPTTSISENGVLRIEVPIIDPHDIFPMVLKYMYGQSVHITINNAIPLLSMSNQLGISHLATTAAAYLANNITSDHVLSVLQKALDLHIDDVIAKCILVLARNFSGLGPCLLNILPADIVLNILRHGSLAVESESDVYNVVCTYVANYAKTTIDSEVTTKVQYQLYETVRFPFLDYDLLSHASANPCVPRDLLAEGLTHWLVNYEGVKYHKSLPSRLHARPAFARIFEYSHDFDKRGVLYYLATNGGAEDWKNPMETKRIILSASSLEKGQCQTIAEREPFETWTADIPASWIQVQLGGYYSLVLTYYSLRHGSNSKQDCLRNWLLQASNDGNNWTTLRRHTNDSSLNSNYGAHSWPVQCAEPFKFFRVLQTGRNSSLHNFLSLSGVELYGDLHEVLPRKKR